MSAQQDILKDQDPDYVSSVSNNEVQQKAFEQNARANATKKIKEIFDKEFSKEIEAKRKEVLEIQERLHRSLKTLHLLRYVIVTDYYTRKQCNLPEVQTESKQTRIHPAIKQLIGKCPRGIETNFIDRPSTSTSGQNASNELDKPSTSKQCLSNSFDKPSTSKDVCIVKTEKETEITLPRSGTKRTCEDDLKTKEPPKKIPRYIPPKSSSPEPAIPSRGAHNKIRRRVIIGNISKWIPPDWRDDSASHKWTVYVRSSKDEVDISEFVSKVRFFLHPTYKPHDVVEITSSPFHLTRRGWGEFPVRVQLHFKNSINKPTDVIHYLKLDQTYTGLQTLGSETLVDIWLTSINPNSNQTLETKDPTNQNGEIPILKESSEKSLSGIDEESSRSPLDHTNSQNKPTDEKIVKLKLCIRNEHDYAAMDYVVENNRTIVHLPNGNSEFSQNNLSSENSETEPENTLNIPQLNGYQNMTEEELAVVVSGSNRSEIHSKSITTMAMSYRDSPGKMQPLNISIPPTFEPKKKQLLVLKNNKLVPTDPVNITKNSVNKVTETKTVENNLKQVAIGTTNKSKTISLSATNSVILNTNSNIPALQIAERNADNILSNGSHMEWDDVLKEKDRKSKMNGKDKPKLTKKDVWEETMKSINNYQFADTVSLVKFIMKRVPMITPEATDAEYKRLHPYTCATLDEFMNYNIGKQKYYEWYRAKLVRSFMKKLLPSEEDLWTMREIITWARFHGYTPLISNVYNKKVSMKSAAKEPNTSNNITCTQTELEDLEEWLRKCKTENELQSDEEVDIEDVTEESSKSKKINRTGLVSDANLTTDDSEFMELPKELEPLYSFVSQVTKQYEGIKLSNETIVPGIKHCAAARVMMQALRSLVGDIARFAHAQALERIHNSDSSNKNPPIIMENDVKGALLKREEFDIFTNAGLGTSQENVNWDLE